LDDRRSDNTFSTIQESRHAYTSVRRQRLQQTRVPESSQPQHGSASSDLIHTDATDSDSPDDDQASTDADAATVNTTDASAMGGIYILVYEDFETLYVKQMFAAFDCVQRCLSCFNLIVYFATQAEHNTIQIQIQNKN